METKYVIRSSSGVKDGNIKEQPVLLLGKTYTVSEMCYQRWLQSAGENDIIVEQILIPNPRKTTKKADADAKEA